MAALGVPAGEALWFNLTPVALFVVTCFVASSSAPLLPAKVLSLLYAFVMMAVIVGTGIQIVGEGASSS